MFLLLKVQALRMRLQLLLAVSEQQLEGLGVPKMYGLVKKLLSTVLPIQTVLLQGRLLFQMVELGARKTLMLAVMVILQQQKTRLLLLMELYMPLTVV